ncbi:hypothetical protein lbkm_1664 [Lachnospiraceae bacterium KM106-2]|nr:hypothetical protein lbkm_1664 [Lachnospiraceae bacterium KM106-2]
MKKNILTIIITVLVALNVILTSLVVFVMVPSLNKVNNLVTDVSDALNLELESQKDKGTNKVSIEDTTIYTLEDSKMNVNLAKSEDGSNHYATMSSISVSLNKKADDYSTINTALPNYKNYITESITDTLNKYTVDQVNTQQETIRAEILKKVQEKFNTKSIISITLGGIVTQ